VHCRVQLRTKLLRSIISKSRLERDVSISSGSRTFVYDYFLLFSIPERKVKVQFNTQNPSAHKRSMDLEGSALNNELKNIDVWLRCNKLSVNVKKTSYLIFKPWQKKCNHNFSISKTREGDKACNVAAASRDRLPLLSYRYPAKSNFVKRRFRRPKNAKKHRT